MPKKDFAWEERVRVYDTDTQGIVHYAGYYRFFTDAFEQFARSKFGLDWPLVNDKVWFVVVESHAKYHKPLRLGDRIRTHVHVAMVGKKALRFDFRIYKGSELSCEGEIVQVAINNRTWKAIALPKDIIKKIQKITD